MKSVYLAGPITGLTYGNASDWRQYAINRLAEWGIGGLDPLRGKQYLSDLGVLDNGSGVSTYADKDEWPLSKPAGITQRDRNDVMTSDLVLANFEQSEQQAVSIGTVIECGWADAFRKPLVIVSPKNSPYRHAMLERMAGFMVETLEQALDIIPAILNARRAWYAMTVTNEGKLEEEEDERVSSE